MELSSRDYIFYFSKYRNSVSKLRFGFLCHVEKISKFYKNFYFANIVNWNFDQKLSFPQNVSISPKNFALKFPISQNFFKKFFHFWGKFLKEEFFKQNFWPKFLSFSKLQKNEILEYGISIGCRKNVLSILCLMASHFPPVPVLGSSLESSLAAWYMTHSS